MNTRFLLVIPLALLGACGGGDPDGDGLATSQEKQLGLDPHVADTDGDGLNDGDEVSFGSDPLTSDADGDGLDDQGEFDAGSDPNVVDTDGDGYTDRDEVFEGHDPTDKRDKIYKGGWPYYYDKDTITGGKANGTVQVGKRFIHLENVKDQFGDKVDLWDFYNDDGVPVVVDVSTQWCPPCNALADWMAGGPDTDGFGTLWPSGPEHIQNGDVYWITVLTQQNSGAPATKDTATEWYDLHTDKHIPVLADDNAGSCGYGADVECFINLAFWPSGALLKANLEVDPASPSDNDITTVLTELNSRFP